MSTKSIIESFEAWREAGEPLVLATVFETDGSTYSKAGHRILIAANGDYQGLVSGGCLEGDLGEHARTVLETGNAKPVTYDLRDDADDLWGIGVGCNGIMKILLQKLDAGSGYEPFNTIARCHLGLKASICATIVESCDAGLPAGATLIDWGHDFRAVEIGSTHRDAIRRQCAGMLGMAEPRLVAHEAGEKGFTALYAPIRTLPRLLVLGAGPDAAPLVRMADELGWLVTLFDHRPAYIESGAFDSIPRLCIDPEKLAGATNLSEFSAAIVMSHHLETDRTYLRQLSDSDIEFIGLLGPEERRNRLISELGAVGAGLKKRVTGPVGLEIGADSPESIALSILAQIHKQLARADA